MSKEVDSSRRSFLKASGLGAVAVAVAGTGLGRLLSGLVDREEPSTNSGVSEGSSQRKEHGSGEIVEGKPL